MDRGPWFLDPEVLVFGQVAGVAVFVMALIVTVVRRRLKLQSHRHEFGAGVAPGAGVTGGGSFDL